MHLREDAQGQIWMASKATFGSLNPSDTEDELHIVTKDKVTPTFSPLSWAQLKTPITGLELDSAGNLWLGTAQNGVLFIKAGNLDSAQPTYYNIENSGLLSNQIRVIHAGSSGEVWFGTANGLSQFDGTDWRVVILSGPDTHAPVTTLLEDSRGRLWVGTEAGGYWRDGQTWQLFEHSAGWPNQVSAQIFFEDSQDGIWAGTAHGPLRFDGQRWAQLGPDIDITAFAEGPPGQVWIGSRQGLVQFDLATKEQEFFDVANSQMVSNRVRNLHVDRDGQVWVSTFTTRQSEGLPWVAIAIGVLFFSYLFISTYKK